MGDRTRTLTSVSTLQSQRTHQALQGCRRTRWRPAQQSPARWWHPDPRRHSSPPPESRARRRGSWVPETSPPSRKGGDLVGMRVTCRASYVGSRGRTDRGRACARAGARCGRRRGERRRRGDRRRRRRARRWTAAAEEWTGSTSPSVGGLVGDLYKGNGPPRRRTVEGLEDDDDRRILHFFNQLWYFIYLFLNKGRRRRHLISHQVGTSLVRKTCVGSSSVIKASVYDVVECMPPSRDTMATPLRCAAPPKRSMWSTGSDTWSLQNHACCS